VPLAPGAPWPKFRADAAQTGRSAIAPSTTKSGAPWSFATGRGIFSSPIVAADGTIYFGSADRNFYALHPDGTLAWSIATGEIIDSSGLLDDRGRVYFGSGDGILRAADATTGSVAWTFQADDPSVNGAFINWFEGNVAIGPDGTLYVPNDDFFFYGIDRDAGTALFRYRMPDQTWSLPAIDTTTTPATLFIGNNNLLPALGKNTFSISGDGSTTNWAVSSLGTVAASPLLTANAVIVGGFDGFVHAYSPDDGTELWNVAARDHIYASAALASDGTIIAPSVDGTVYAMDARGNVRWTFDAGTPIRSSPAIDGAGNVYFGGGDGRLYVLNPDGSLRWAMKLIDDVRNDLNASPALGPNAIYIGGESGELFGVPYDWCLEQAQSDPRCGPGVPVADGASLVWTNLFGDPLASPESLDANERITLALTLKQNGTEQLAILDSSAIQVTTTPQTNVTVSVSGDGKFMSITPNATWTPGPLDVAVSAQYLVDLERDGLRLSGGQPGGAAQATFHTTINAPSGGAIDPSATYEVFRLAVPLPTVMPSYNQIGFDSLHYLFSTVELSNGVGVAWMIGAMLPEGQSASVPDPTTKAFFPLVLDVTNDVVTMNALSGLDVTVSNLSLPFSSFRVATSFDSTSAPNGTCELAGSSVCGDIPFYGPYLQQLGLCNPQTDVVQFLGAANVQERSDLVAPSGVGQVAFSETSSALVATLTGSSVVAADHVVALLAIDASTGAPVALPYATSTAVTANSDGTLASVSVPTSGTLPASIRTYLMIDTFVGAKGTVP